MINFLLKPPAALNSRLSLFSSSVRLLFKPSTYLSKRCPNKKSYSTTIPTSPHQPPNPATNEALINELNRKLGENKLKNILVYSNPKEGSMAINLMGCFAGLLLFAASWSTWHLFSSVRFKKRNIDNESGFFKVVLTTIGSEYFKIALCGVIVIVGAISIVGSIFLTLRSVNKLYLLKGGKTIGLITDGVFGKRMNYTLELNQTEFTTARRARTPQVLFKNKKHFFYFMMNNVHGEYHEKALFDHVICTKR